MRLIFVFFVVLLSMNTIVSLHNPGECSTNLTNLHYHPNLERTLIALSFQVVLGRIIPLCVCHVLRGLKENCNCVWRTCSFLSSSMYQDFFLSFSFSDHRLLLWVRKLLLCLGRLFFSLEQYVTFFIDFHFQPFIFYDSEKSLLPPSPRMMYVKVEIIM